MARLIEKLGRDLSDHRPAHVLRRDRNRAGRTALRLVYVPIAVVLSGTLWPERPFGQRPERLIPLIGVNALILGLFLVPWTTRKPFLRDLYSIKAGMTESEARRIMAAYKFEGVDAANSLVFRHSNETLLNADMGIVAIKDDEVIDIRFLHD